GDALDVTFDEPDAASPAVTSISATRPPDPGKWAIVIVNAQFDDASVQPFLEATNASAALEQALTTRYAVSRDHVIVLSDPSRVRLRQGLPDAVAKAEKASQLLVVIAGRALADSKSPPLLQPKDFARDQAANSGVPLDAVLSEVEKSSATQKLVILDLVSEASGSAAGPSSAAAMVDSIRGTRSHPLLKTTPVFATDQAAAQATTAAGLVNALAS